MAQRVYRCSLQFNLVDKVLYEQALSELQGCLDRIMQQAQHTQLENLIQRARNQPLTADEKKLLQKLLQKS